MTTLLQAHRNAEVAGKVAAAAAGPNPKKKARAYLRDYRRSLLAWAAETNPVKVKP